MDESKQQNRKYGKDLISLEINQLEFEKLTSEEKKNSKRNQLKLIHSRVKENKRLGASVECLIYKQNVEQVLEWKTWIERIISSRIEKLIQNSKPNSNNYNYIWWYEDNSANNKENEYLAQNFNPREEIWQ